MCCSVWLGRVAVREVVGTYADAREEHARYGILELLVELEKQVAGYRYLISNHGNELAVLVLRRGRHGC
jgi:hypothetical protein